MPIILEPISHLSSQDSKALVAVYQDDPIADAQVAGMENPLQQRLETGLELYAGRFNGQLVAALWLEPIGSIHKLRDLCVHPATRRRGVARQTLTLMANYAKRHTMHLYIEEQSLPPQLSHLPEQCGFSQSANPTHQPRGWYSDTSSL